MLGRAGSRLAQATQSASRQPSRPAPSVPALLQRDAALPPPPTAQPTPALVAVASAVAPAAGLKIAVAVAVDGAAAGGAELEGPDRKRAKSE